MERDQREPELALGEKLLKLDRDQQKYEIEAFFKSFIKVLKALRQSLGRKF